jgi:hypothetical protein
MGMTMFEGKTLFYTSEDDSIGLDTVVEYSDQNGNVTNIDMKKFIEKLKKLRTPNTMLINDIEQHELVIGFPIIIALNDIATELGDEVNEILISKEIKE